MDASTRSTIMVSSSTIGFIWMTTRCAALARLGVHGMHANLGSVITSIGGVNKLFNLSGFVIGVCLQMMVLNIVLPLMHGT